jgi:hypothetical protein
VIINIQSVAAENLYFRFYLQHIHLRAAFNRKWPSMTSPFLRASTGILKPYSRMLLHKRSTTASFLRGFHAYKTKRSIGQIWISSGADAIIAP